MAELDGGHVLLSASFPSGDRGERFRPYDIGGISDAVISLVEAVFTARGRLVFGGHPTITPLVLRMAAEHGVRDAVEVYQSDEFRDRITEPTRQLESRGYGRIIPTPRLSTRDDSLALMRSEMIDRTDDLVGTVFVGGMEGIPLEYEAVGKQRGDLPRLPIARPGGAAAKIAPSGGGGGHLPEEVLDRLHSPRYPLVAATVVRFLAAR